MHKLQERVAKLQEQAGTAGAASLVTFFELPIRIQQLPGPKTACARRDDGATLAVFAKPNWGMI